MRGIVVVSSSHSHTQVLRLLRFGKGAGGGELGSLLDLLDGPVGFPHLNLR